MLNANAINEFRIQQATDNLDRLSQRVGEPIEAQIRFRFGDFDSVGKFDFLPIFVEEEKLQVQDNLSYLFGDHDTKFGIDYQKDDLAQLFAGSRDGRYDFTSPEAFLANEASNVRIYFGSVQFPNYDETQELLGVYAQDSYKPNANLTLNYGIRYNATYNPDNLPHLFEEGRNIPDDTDNWAPRFGFAYAANEGRDVFPRWCRSLLRSHPVAAVRQPGAARTVCSRTSVGSTSVRVMSVSCPSALRSTTRTRPPTPRTRRPTSIPTSRTPRPCGSTSAGNAS